MQKQIEQLYNPLFLYIKKRVNDPMDAEDLTQEVFYKLSNSKNSDIKSIKSWVYTIAKNTIIDYYRKKKNIHKDIENHPDSQRMDTDTAVEELSNCCIAPFVNQLPEDYRTLIRLSDLEEVPQKEIAARLNMNYTTVRSKVQRGRAKLRDLFSDCCHMIQGGKGSIMDFEKKNECAGDC